MARPLRQPVGSSLLLGDCGTEVPAEFDSAGGNDEHAP